MDYYDRFRALSLAVACDLAYRGRNRIRQEVRRWGMTFVNMVDKRKGADIDTQCFIMSDERNVIVVFRGSESKQDWFANFQASQDPGPLQDTGAHEGFQDALYPAVIALTRHVNALSQQKRVWVTGHSLGGALCSLYAGMLVENGIEVYGIYTFASPRPGSAAYERQLNAIIPGPHYRVVNDGDIVPHLPPEPFFSHPGRRVILKSRHRERTKSSWLKQRIAALKHFVKVTGERFDIADNHRLSADPRKSYIPRLIKDLERC